MLSGLIRLKKKFTIKPPASMHKPIKIAQATICKTVNIYLLIIAINFTLKLS